MSQEIAIRGPQSLVEIIELGKIFRASGYFRDVRDEAQAVVKILYGRELGFTPIVSMMGVFIIDGKPSVSAGLLASMIKRSGKYNYRVREQSDTACKIEFFENGESIGFSSFTMDDARRAGITMKDNWKKYPAAMLFARTISIGMRSHCPDVSSSSLYVPEELGATVNETGEVIAMPEPSGEGKVYTRPSSPPSVSPVVQPSPLSGTAETKAAPTLQAPGVAPQAEGDGLTPSAKDLPFTPADPPDDPFAPKTITSAQAGQLARRFRESLRPELQPMAEELRHDFLRINGFMDGPNPSSLVIPAERFIEVGKAATKFAAGL